MPLIGKIGGTNRIISTSLIVLTMAIFLRAVGNVPMLFVSSLTVGIAIAVLNFSLPVWVKENTEDHSGLVTGIYITTMGVFAALSVAVAVPLARATSWGWRLAMVPWIVWGFGIWLVSKDQITVGVLTAFLAYIGRFYTRLDSMSRIVSSTQKAASGAKRIFEILDHVSSVPEPQNPVAMSKVEGRITLTDASFRYGNRAVIKHLNLDIRPGEMIGLVGHSGSGKSTLVNLMCRFYDLSEGSIALDGVDIKQLKVADYRRQIGLVLQEPFLFFGTIADNIAYGMPEATRDQVVAAARAAHAHEFILRMPQGYDSLVGERGQGLSGGERQRISIARALLIDPRILILDEATSAVDTETEKEIQNALDNLVRGRTTIAIAHRLSTLRKADRLVVMDKGLIVEEGTHDVLIEKQGAYWRLYEAQQRQAEAEGAVLRESVTS
jgi:ATP-binding cassette subfamily B protein